MTNTLNGKVSHSKDISEPELIDEAVLPKTDDWSDVTRETLDNLPQVWTRGILYFLVVFVSIILPWTVFAKIDETGTARGRVETQDKTVKLDAAVAGTVAEIRVQEGDTVKAGQTLLILDSELVKSELQQAQDKLEGQLNRLTQLNSAKNQLLVSLATQEQQNQSQQLEKQAQIEQFRQNLQLSTNTFNLQKAAGIAQLNQAKQTIIQNEKAKKLAEVSLAIAQRELERYQKAFKDGIAAEVNVVEKEDALQERIKLYEQTKADIQQAKLRLTEQQSSYERNIRQANAEIEQAQLRLKEQESSYQTLTRSGKLAILRIAEQEKNIETEITSLQSDIAQTKSQITAWQFQLQQREIKATSNGILFQLPIQKPGAVVQSGTMLAEIAPANSPFIIRATMATTESGSLHTGLPVKLKFDAYPFQDYGVISGELIKISPTTTEIDTPNGKVAAYNLDIALKQTCLPAANKCIPVRPGDTATAEVVIRQRRIIDFLLDPFKQLQQGGVKL
ncbi:HlyD family efflux transporter periplasmic adaptor subunit [Nostoc sp. FACHB-87]|uniref:HlyD family efflux transporter periplasmic adaptor subunit n=1 Tax=Nostocaceae TaxID=1162 RepID=UPI001688FD63|nr:MULTISPECIES: HlyD family efflux transporter periplasmic adaptor subunit [Nostocaceae]MBD2455992.1 HlyD family efflux transporter periplasmic adaptor subunit [Nostoc sp. FACHB-87]MBD2476585.1 HlyD family efflux transporter periplasmic adaptor subunit [Anabaena sp. FACHB-83]